MLRGLWKLTWVEIKIFIREPMGVIGTVGIPLVLFLLLGRMAGEETEELPREAASWFDVQLPVFAAIFIALGAVLSLVAIISIYREGGILKRLRATPLRPVTILGAHVVVKLLLTATTLGLLVLAGKRFYPGGSRSRLRELRRSPFSSARSAFSPWASSSRASSPPPASPSPSAARCSTRCSRSRASSSPSSSSPRHGAHWPTRCR